MPQLKHRFKKIVIFCNNLKYHQGSMLQYPDLVYSVTNNRKSLFSMIDLIVVEMEAQIIKLEAMLEEEQ